MRSPERTLISIDPSAVMRLEAIRVAVTFRTPRPRSAVLHLRVQLNRIYVTNEKEAPHANRERKA